MKFVPILFAIFLVLGCSSGDEGQKNESPGRDTKPMANEAPVISQDPAPKASPEEKEKADHILRFSNLATGVLTDGYYALPDALYDNVNKYLSTWRLPKKPRVHGKALAKDAMQPPEGVFDDKEAAALDKAFDGMDKALEAMLADYGKLERYVNDDSIRDNGKEARRLGKKIGQSHEQFMKARKSWLEMVDVRAEEAQALLLREHPLERQILDAGKMFVIFREISEQLALENPDKAAIGALRQNLDQLWRDAEKPPFRADPQLERAYRGFLKNVAVYRQSLDAALKEGFFAPQLKAITADVIECRKSFNAFAELANNLALKR